MIFSNSLLNYSLKAIKRESSFLIRVYYKIIDNTDVCLPGKKIPVAGIKLLI